jgi:AcrR family transcriptional regulator
MDLFEAQGYPATTVESIAARAGVARRTFFHHFASKDAVVFPDHDALIERVRNRLEERGTATPVEAVGETLRIILTSYLDDADLAVRRYRLARATPELREREVAWVQRYQLLFSRYLGRRFRDLPDGALAADVVAAGLVALHNHVLRQWLKDGGHGDALGDLGRGLQWFDQSLRLVQRGDRPRRLVVAVFDDDVDPSELANRIDQARSIDPAHSAPGG